MNQQLENHVIGSERWSTGEEASTNDEGDAREWENAKYSNMLSAMVLERWSEDDAHLTK